MNHVRAVWIEGLEMKIASTRTRPKIGDIIEIKASFSTRNVQHGIVLNVRTHKDGSWSAAELFINNNQRRWYTRGALGRILGRPKGISRIDQPTRRTHGWFVRLGYEGKNPRLARLFSDQKHHGIDGALQAALAFYAAQQRAQDLAAPPESKEVEA